MRFNSFDYLAFLPAVILIYWLLPRRVQNCFLLIASYFFYGYVHPWFLYLILASTVLDYFCALGIGRFPKRSKTFLWISVCGNLSLLAVFKYCDFFIGNVQALLAVLGIETSDITLRILLPPGISFYTFQTLSYTIDVYRGRFRPRTDFIAVATFVSFFPQLVAGPIERARNLLPQFERKRSLTAEDIRLALTLIIWGYFKKTVIADTVAVYANKVFAVQEPGFYLLWAGVFAFYIQIYADFSAYTDIARGSARLFGFHLMVNFNHPYLCTSPADFWRRWHISLTTWLRDYIALSLNRFPWWKKHRNANILFTLALCGLWHGASWNFVIWGVYCGTALILFPYYERLAAKMVRKESLKALIGWGTCLVLLNIGFLIFREHQLRFLLQHVIASPFANAPLQNRAALQIFLLTLIYSLPLWIHGLYDQFVKSRISSAVSTKTLSFLMETAVTAAIFLGILLLHSDSHVQFIYFQF